MVQRGYAALVSLAVVLVGACSGSVETSPGGTAGDAASDGVTGACTTCLPSTTGGSSGSGNGTSSSGSSSGTGLPGTSMSSSSGSSGGYDATTGGCGFVDVQDAGDGSAPKPEAFVAGDIGPGNLLGVNDSAACGQGDLTWTIGNPVSPIPVVYSDASAQVGSGAVQISCWVDACGAGFSIQAAAELDGSNGGTLFVSGTVNPTGTSVGLSGSFSTMGQTFLDHDCTFTLTYNDAPLPANGQPAQGRVWGHLDCPHAADASQEGVGEDGSAITRTCDARADFLFENCQ